MKSTDSIVVEFEKEEESDFHDFSFSFSLHDEDLNMALEIIRNLNDAKVAPPLDLADFLLGCVTHEIHALWEEMTGKPFVLRKDRNNVA